MSKSVFRVTALVVVAGLSSSAFAGGRGFMVHGPGGGVRMGRAMPPVAGTWHVRNGGSFITGQGRAGWAFGHPVGPRGFGRTAGGYGFGQNYGHTNTAIRRPAFLARPGFGYGRQFSYGHTATAPNGLVRYRFGSRYGVHDRGRLVTRYGYPHVPGYGFGGYGYGDGGYGSTAGGGFVPVPVPTGGYGEPALAAQYSEPALDQESYAGSYGAGGGAYPSVVGTGGPQVIVVNNNYGASNCHCDRGRPGPVVYRYGVGSYY